MLRDGRLPALAALRAEGALASLDTSPSLFEAAIYPTLYSGVEVGDHALYSALPWSPDEQRVRSWETVAKPPSVWERLARAGRRALVVDPYQGWAPDEGDGLWVSGWQFQNRMVLPRWSVPRDALSQSARTLGRPPAAETTFGRLDAGTLLAMRHALVEAPGRAAALVERVLARERFDLLWVTFSGVHLAGHYLWDGSLLPEGIDPAARRTLDGALGDVYAATDAALGRIVAALPPDTDVIVFSPDGMGPNTSRSDLLPGMLAAVLGDHPERAVTAGGALWRWRAAIPPSYRAAIARLLSDDRVRAITAALHTVGTDWRGTRAFALPGDCHGFVRVNLRGRERDGIVPAAEASSLLETIAAGLATFHDPDGAPSVAAVERLPPDVARGRHAHLLPDLVVRWGERPSARLDRVTSARFGRVARSGVGPGLSGNHTEGAWTLVVPRRGRPAAAAAAPRLIDLAATACAHADVAATDLAGAPLLEPA